MLRLRIVTWLLLHWFGQYLPHHLPLGVGEAEIAAGVAVGEFFVIESEQMQDGGVPVVDRHLASTAS